MTLDLAIADFDPSTLTVPLADSDDDGAWCRGWELPEPLTVSEWADVHRYLTREGAAEPGPWSTDRVPYAREIMDCLSDEHPAKKVVFMKSTQVSGTEILNNFCGYIVHHSPGPTMIVMPTEKLAQRWSKQRLRHMIEASPALRGLIRPASTRDAGNTTLLKEFPGGMLVIAGANSSSDLRSMPARRVLADEVDEYPENLDDQGAPLELAERRASTFVRRKVFVCSSPKLKATSVIWREYEASDQREFHVACPHCLHRQTLVIEQLLDDATYLCIGCGQRIEEHHKPQMLATGVWIAKFPEREVVGFHINALYAALGLGYSWKEIVALREQARLHPDKLVTFTNTILGLPFEGERQQQDAGEVEQRAEPGWRRGTVPRGGLTLTLGVDCQHDRFACHTVAWGRGEHGCIIDYEEIPGDPSLADGYAELDAWMQRTYANAHGTLLLPRMVAIDGGHWTEEVAKFVRRLGTLQHQVVTRLVKVGANYLPQSAAVVRGRSASSDRVVYRPAKTEVNARGKTLARSIGVWGVGTDVAKQLLYGRMARDAHAEAPEERMLRFPGGIELADLHAAMATRLPSRYYAGLTCEYFDLAAKRWITPRHARNEPLDTLVYAYWAALCPVVRLDLRREHEWKALEDQLEPEGDLFAPSPALSMPMPSSAMVNAAMVSSVSSPETSTAKPVSAVSVSREISHAQDDLGSDAWSRRL